jgi:hypothetical protein
MKMSYNLNARLAELLEELAIAISPSQQRHPSNHHHESSRSRPHSHPHSRPHTSGHSESSRSRPHPHHHLLPHTSGHSQSHRHRDHPLTSQPTSSHEPKDYDLDLKSLWFAKSPPAFPPPSMNRGGKLTYASSSGWSSSGVRKTHTFTAHVRNTATLASSRIHLTWDASNPTVTVKAYQRHDPPPRKLSQSELVSCRERYATRSYTFSAC